MKQISRLILAVFSLCLLMAAWGSKQAAAQLSPPQLTNCDIQSIIEGHPYYDNCGSLADQQTFCNAVAVVGGDNIQTAFNFFVGNGLSPAQAAGVVGNLMQESSLNPEVMQKGGTSKNPADAGSGGYGIAQWTPGAKLIDIAKSLNITGAIYELPTQLQIVLAEMKGSSPTGAHDVFGALQKINNVADATEYFDKYFEAPKDGGNLPQRQAYAQMIIQKYGNYTPQTNANGCNSAITPDCQSATGVARILCAAKAYDPISYEESTRGGHQGAAAWHQTCPTINASCVLDCSGLVNIAVYDAFGVDRTDNTDGERADTALWQPIQFNQLQPGDLIQPNSGHVEIVDHVDGNTIYTFGAHSSHYPQPEQVGPSKFSNSGGNLYLHYVGPGVSK